VDVSSERERFLPLGRMPALRKGIVSNSIMARNKRTIDPIVSRVRSHGGAAEGGFSVGQGGARISLRKGAPNLPAATAGKIAASCSRNARSDSSIRTHVFPEATKKPQSRGAAGRLG
jgi:hypothetical protein